MIPTNKPSWHIRLSTCPMCFLKASSGKVQWELTCCCSLKIVVGINFLCQKTIHMQTYCIHPQPQTLKHTLSLSSHLIPFFTGLVFNHWGGVGRRGLWKLFSHAHPTVMLWLITRALRLNCVLSIPGSMELWEQTSRHRSPSHVVPLGWGSFCVTADKWR